MYLFSNASVNGTTIRTNTGVGLAEAASHNGPPPACILSIVTFVRVKEVANVLAVSFKVIFVGLPT
jgi:hypothetical protein